MSLWISDSSHGSRENLHVSDLNVPSGRRGEIVQNDYRPFNGKGSVHQVGSIVFLAGFLPDDLPHDIVNFLQGRLDSVRKVPAFKSGPGDLDDDWMHAFPHV